MDPKKFSPKLLFQIIVQLISGANKEGYNHALVKVFGSRLKDMPLKSSLCKIRQRISFKFFEDTFLDLLKDFEPQRRTFKSLCIYSIDGLQMTLPRTNNIVDAGYTGRAVSKYRESYMPRMYLTHAYDVLSGVTKAFKYHTRPDEITDAVNMVAMFEKNSVCLYDRLYICARLIRAHIKTGNYFLFRARAKGVKKEVQEFFNSKRRRSSYVFEGLTIYLIKIKNQKTKKDDVFSTNLPPDWVTKKTIRRLYTLRWGVETSFCELTSTAKIQQWHSKFLNGILQELYAMFWVINYTKIQMYLRQESTTNPLNSKYSKPNFKLIFNWVKDRMGKILNKTRRVLDGMKWLIKISKEKREHLSRSYRREIKGPASPYPYNNTVWNII